MTPLPGAIRRVTLAAALLLVSAAARAQIARVFVSISGNDVNVCSNVATPCRTFGGGITQVDPGGEVIVLDTGSYGGVTITKAVTINVPPGIVAFTAQPIVVDATPGDVVTIRGLTSKALTPGSGYGIDFFGGKSLTIENCVFSDWNIGVRDQISAQLFVKGSIFRNNQYGVTFGAHGGVVFGSIEHSRFEGNTLAGVFVADFGQVGIRECVASGNGSGFIAGTFTAALSDLTVENSLIVNNSSIGVGSSGASGGVGTARVSNCTVTGNLNGLYQEATGVTLSRSNNTVKNNGTNLQGSIGSYTPN